MSEEERDSEEEYKMDEEDAESSSESSSVTSPSPTSSSTWTSSSSETESGEDESLNEKITLKKDKHGNGKWKLLGEKNAFKKEWLEVYDWLDEHPDDPKLAVCNKCFTTMKAQKNILETHQKSKKHLKNIGVIVDEPRKEDKPTEVRSGGISMGGMGVDHHVQMDDQINFFTESPADAAHQAVTNLIDKLVEKYHENRLQNLRVQNEAILKLNVERAKFVRSENERKFERRVQKEAYLREAEETSLRFLQLQHETKLNSIEKERDAKLRAVEQELVFAKQEYEKKVRLLDSQLSSMK